MSWRSYFRTNLDEACDPSSENHPSPNSNSLSSASDTKREIQLLLDKIGKRDVVVDACLPPQLAQELRRNNINAIWVPAILGDGASDDEIMRELFFEDPRLWGESSNPKVLLTRDVEFYRRIEKKAILVNHRIAKLSGESFHAVDERQPKRRCHLNKAAHHSNLSFKNRQS
jgi:hypothetical protein